MKNVEVTLLDRQNIVSEATLAAFRALQWRPKAIAMDAMVYLERSPEACAVTTNLFLHHFEGEQLERLLLGTARIARVFIACETRRRPAASPASRCGYSAATMEPARRRGERTGGLCRARVVCAVASEPARWDLRENIAWPLHPSSLVACRKAVPR